MRIALAVIIVLHALIHVLGFAKAFGLLALPELKLAISRPMGALWLVSALLLLATATILFAAPRFFWILGLLAMVASQVAIVASWSDARFGTLPNVVLLAAVLVGAFAWGPFGLRAEYDRLVRDGIASANAPRATAPGIEPDLNALPAAVQRYLRFAGAVGTPRVQGFKARMKGRIRSSATADWMPFVAEQHSFFDPPRRYFWMEATRGGIPVEGLHVFDATGASMRVRLLSLVPVVDLEGDALMRTETVTVLNDISIFAPSRLLDTSIAWKDIDAHQAEATFTNGAHTIRAMLVFDTSGAMVDFWSDDRPALGEDGKSMVQQRWSTPLSDYRDLGLWKTATRGEGRYAAPDGAYAYLELEVEELQPFLAPGATAGD